MECRICILLIFLVKGGLKACYWKNAILARFLKEVLLNLRLYNYKKPAIIFSCTSYLIEYATPTHMQVGLENAVFKRLNQIRAILPIR